nr:hypothetical protein [Azospirillum sp. 412522]
MPYKAHESCRHKIPRARYRAENWWLAMRRSVGVAIFINRMTSLGMPTSRKAA